MATVTAESLRDFVQRHGGEPIRLRNGHLMLPSGAQTDDHGSARIEPPEDPTERLTMQKRYAVARADKLEKDFNAAKLQLSFDLSNAARYVNLPVPTIADAEALEALAAEVRRWRAKVADLDSQLGNSEKAERARQREADMDARRQRIAETAARLTEINI